MIDMVMAIAIPLARTYGMNKAIDIAYERLGIDKPSSGVMDIFTGGGINQTFSPTNFLKRQAVNLGVKGLFNLAPKALGPLAIGGGLAYIANQFNPLNPNAKNYSPNLRGQIDYLSGRDNFIGINPNTGLTVYGPGSVLAGKGVTSLFGSNNYQTALDNYIDYFENRIKQGKPINEEKYEQAKKEKDDFFEYRADIRDKAKTKSSQPSFQGPTGKDIHGGGGGNNKSNGSSKSGGFSSSERGASLHGAKGGLARYYRGGIVSLYG